MKKLNAILIATLLAAASAVWAGDSPATKAPAKAEATKAPAPSIPAAGTPASTPAAAPSTALVDINTASTAELRKLPGIAEARSAAIVKGRPYKRKDELVQKKILSQSVYDGIKEKIVAKQAG